MKRFQRAVAAACVAVCLPGPSHAQSPEASQAQDLSNCAGAIAAFAGLNVISPERNASGEWSVALGAVLARLNREAGVEGMTGRIAADAARLYWAERPRAAQEAEANACRTRFGAS
jgi:hypothetical protein